MRANTLDDFWRRVAPPDENGCMLWQGQLSARGYGVFSIGGKKRRAHVVAYEAKVGPVPEGRELDHVAERGCRSHACCNHEHTEPVTHAENMRRAADRASECPKGHAFTAANSYRNSRGHRECRICRSKRRRIRYLAIGR